MARSGRWPAGKKIVPTIGNRVHRQQLYQPPQQEKIKWQHYTKPNETFFKAAKIMQYGIHLQEIH